MNTNKNGIMILPDVDSLQRRSKYKCLRRRRPFKFSDATKKKAYAKYKGLCQWCWQRVGRWHEGAYHHLIPISHGGGKKSSNCLLLHPRCHYDKEVHDFLHRLGLEPIGKGGTSQGAPGW